MYIFPVSRANIFFLIKSLVARESNFIREREISNTNRTTNMALSCFSLNLSQL